MKYIIYDLKIKIKSYKIFISIFKREYPVMVERRGRKYEVVRISDSGEECMVKKEIYELSDEEIKECELLCAVRASNAVQDTFSYCLRIATRHCKDFDKLVYGYKQTASDKKEFVVKVSFYKKRS